MGELLVSGRVTPKHTHTHNLPYQTWLVEGLNVSPAFEATRSSLVDLELVLKHDVSYRYRGGMKLRTVNLYIKMSCLDVPGS